MNENISFGMDGGTDYGKMVLYVGHCGDGSDHRQFPGGKICGDNAVQCDADSGYTMCIRIYLLQEKRTYQIANMSA